MTNQLLNQSANALEQASIELDKLRESTRDMGGDSNGIMVLSLIIESTGLLGQAISNLHARLTTAGVALAHEPHQCPECGLPIGTNASHDDSNGCHTCTLAIQQHVQSQGNKCPDCGCLIGTNGVNCRRCLDEAYFQRTEKQRGLAGDRCEAGNECGRVGCPNCQA